MYTVKEVSKMLDLSEHTIRYYTNLGLIPTLTRDENNVRLFNQESIEWLTNIKCLRDSGLSIKSLKEYVKLCLVGDSTLKIRHEIILKQQKEIEQKYEEIQKQLIFIKNKSKWYEDILNRKRIDDSIPNKH